MLIGETTNSASALSNACIWPNAADSSPNIGWPITKSPSTSSTLTTRPDGSQFLINPYALYDEVDAPWYTLSPIENSAGFMYAIILSPKSVVWSVNDVCPVVGSPTGALVKAIVVSVFALARDVESLTWLFANPFARVGATV